jgi:hypothetical protein
MQYSGLTTFRYWFEGCWNPAVRMADGRTHRTPAGSRVAAVFRIPDREAAIATMST